MIEIIFNGHSFNIPENTSLQDFLKSQDLMKENIAIEVNYEVIQRSSYSKIMLQNQMKIEAITFVGGG